MGNFCQQVLKPLGSYTQVFTILHYMHIYLHMSVEDFPSHEFMQVRVNLNYSTKGLKEVRFKVIKYMSSKYVVSNSKLDHFTIDKTF